MGEPESRAAGAAIAATSLATGTRPTRWLDWQRRRHLSREDYAEYQFQSARGRLEPVATRIGCSAPRVLDVGCGLGGMSTAYALEGAKVTAIDAELYDPESIRFAEAFARSKGAAVTFVAVGEHQWPMADATFDVVFLDSVVEHASSPPELLRESARVLCPGGWMFISFPVYYGPFGGHIDDYISIPWFHLLPRAFVLRSLRRCRPLGAYFTPGFVEGVYLSLNRLTFRHFKGLVRTLSLELVELRRNAYLTTAGNQLVFDLRTAMRRRDWRTGWSALRRIPADFGLGDFCLFLMLASTLPLMRVPLLQECFLGGVRATLHKPHTGPTEP